MGVNYGNSKIFDDYAGPAYNARHIRPGKVAPDASRLMFLKMYDGMMQQMGYASDSEQGRENALNNLAAQYSPGRVGVDTDRHLAALMNAGQGRENQAYQQALAQHYSPEYAAALAHSIRGQTQRGYNQYLAGEGQRQEQANGQYYNVLNQMQQMPLAQVGMGILSPNEAWRQESENRRAAGQASQGLGGFMSSISPIGGLLTGLGNFGIHY